MTCDQHFIASVDESADETQTGQYRFYPLAWLYRIELVYRVR